MNVRNRTIKFNPNLVNPKTVFNITVIVQYVSNQWNILFSEYSLTGVLLERSVHISCARTYD